MLGKEVFCQAFFIGVIFMSAENRSAGFFKKPYRKLGILITIWSFFINTIFAEHSSPVEVIAISPPSSFIASPIYQEERLAEWGFKREAIVTQITLLITKALARNCNIRELKKSIRLNGLDRYRVPEIEKKDGFYVTYRKDKTGPPVILHYFLKKEYAKTKKYMPVAFEGYREILVEKISRRQYMSIKIKEMLPRALFSPEGGCEDEIINAIDNARRNIDISVYRFTNRDIARALQEANKRGVKIRVLLDRSQEIKKLPLDLKGKNIEVRQDKRKYGLMHNKFMIIDRKMVVAGSYNWTDEAEKVNRENLIVIPHSMRFKREFEWLWYNGTVRAPPNTIAPPLKKNGIRAFFSPGRGCEDEIIRLIQEAKRERIRSPDKKHVINIALYYFTNRKIADELFDAKETGVDVNILLDKSQRNRSDSILEYFRKLEERTRKAEPRKGFRNCNRGSLKVGYYRIAGGIMHNKFALIGNATLTGSYNWTKSAEKNNRENLIVIPKRMASYSDEFARLWKGLEEIITVDRGEKLSHPPRGPPEDFTDGAYKIFVATKELSRLRVFDSLDAVGRRDGPPVFKGRYLTEPEFVKRGGKYAIRALKLWTLEDGKKRIFNNATYRGEVRIKKGTVFIYGGIAGGYGLQTLVDWEEINRDRVEYLWPTIMEWRDNKWRRLQK